MRTPTVAAALALAAAACCYAKPPAPVGPAPEAVPAKVDLVDAQDMRIANLQLQVVEQQAALAQAQVEVARAARAKVADKLVAKYHLDVAAGDDFDGTSLAIKRGARKAVTLPAVPPAAPPIKHVTPKPLPPVWVPPRPPGR